MEHQVFVPVPVDRLREALAEPARVARAVPGLQQDAGAEPLSGRLKLRVGGHSVTYRGALRVSPREDGGYAVDGEAAEARGTGAAKVALTLRLEGTADGTTVTVEGTAEADGRIAELPADAVSSAVTRLLNRFVESLAASPDNPDRGPGPESASVFGTGAPQPAPDPSPAPSPDPAADDATADLPADRFDGSGAPPAEAAHARRTMIGRSAEEVDHAPPRGRYAPVPAPQSGAGNQILRWAAPAAALAVASAIVASRALRRRR
ncbi:SRPBCC domain-containing protein [Streptomyces cellostaticus]|uniref:SRPBCC domain-containing protein n=1 Tax=Streptomyces cellostaticus TaxID=67285 RepID=UPI002025F83B|nr:SRPBCC domain-containing protein [Streptomyces cellostaticus]